MATKSKIEVLLTANEVNLIAALRRGQVGLQQFGNTANKEAQKAKSAFAGLSSIKLPLAGVLAGAGIGYYAKQVIQIADEYTNLNSRLKLVTSSSEDYAKVTDRLYQISQETGTVYASNADSYSKLARSFGDLGASSDETLQAVELINKALTVNGSTTEMSSAFMLQFGQAMGSGVLQGDEFRSMLENNSFFAAELAKALGTNIAGLRKMSKEGALTADVLRGAFPKMAKTVNEQFAQLEPTVARAMTTLQNAFKRIVSESNQAGGGTKGIAKSITDLAETIDTHRDGIISLFTSMINGAGHVVSAVGNIGQSFEGWAAVKRGDLGFFDFATMNAQDLNTWLKKNVATLGETGAAAKKAGAEIVSATKGSADAQKQLTKEALAEMTKQYKAYLDEVKKLQGSIAANQRTTAEDLRDMARSGMTDIAAWQDRNREAGEFVVKAKEAAAQAKQLYASGNAEGGKEQFTLAVEYADKARSAYKSLNEEVKRGDQVVISQQQALQTAMAGVQTAGNIKDQVLGQQVVAINAAKDALNQQAGGQLDESITKAKTGMADLAKAAEETKTKIQNAFADSFKPPEDGDWGNVWSVMEQGSANSAKSVTSDWDRVWDNFLASGSEDINTLESKLRELTKDRTIKVYIDEVQRHAEGGQIQRFARGGKLPGFGGGDRISALLEAGEFVIRKEAVAKFGAGIFHALNNLRLPEIPRFALGGPVGFAQGGPVTAAAGEAMTINLNFGGGSSIPVTSTRDNARKLLREFTRMQSRSSQ